MKHYETIFIINPNLGDEEYGETLSKFRDLIEKTNGVIVKVDEWGKQKLAYSLKKFDSGFYILVDYCGDPGLIVELERNLKLDERILKYQTVKLADKADPEALIREEQETSDKRPKKAAEVPSRGEGGAAAEDKGSVKVEGSAEADRSAEADGPAKDDEKSAKIDEEPAKPSEGAPESDEPAVTEKPADAGPVQKEEVKVEDSAEADSSAKADGSVKADGPEEADKSTEADEGSDEIDESAKADEIPQKETDVQTEGEKKS
jgi:small subunit ribosomal protein S6